MGSVRQQQHPLVTKEIKMLIGAVIMALLIGAVIMALLIGAVIMVLFIVACYFDIETPCDWNRTIKRWNNSVYSM